MSKIGEAVGPDLSHLVHGGDARMSWPRRPETRLGLALSLL